MFIIHFIEHKINLNFILLKSEWDQLDSLKWVEIVSQRLWKTVNKIIDMDTNAFKIK